MLCAPEAAAPLRRVPVRGSAGGRLHQGQGYERLVVSDEADLVANLRAQLEALNRVSFTDGEWKRLFKGWIAADNDGIAEKTRRIQRDHVHALLMDDGTVRNISLIDKRNVHNNRLQVMN